jgi:hypothetical protein
MRRPSNSRRQSTPAVLATFHAALPGYAPTPLVDLPGLAAQLAVARLLVEDESHRFGLRAFKMLGASWAIERLCVSGRPGRWSPRPTATMAAPWRGLGATAPAHQYVDSATGSRISSRSKGKNPTDSGCTTKATAATTAVHPANRNLDRSDAR